MAAKRIVSIWLLFALAFAGPIHAEGGCPPGQVPQQGNGWMSCVPAGSSAASSGTLPPPRSVEERWVALTADAPKGLLGQSGDSKTQEEAESSAMRDCTTQGGTNCIVAVSARNGCIAMATSSKVFGVGSGPSETLADADAVERCRKGGDENCNVIYKRCVRPKVL
jgi:hypothetical protein